MTPASGRGGAAARLDAAAASGAGRSRACRAFPGSGRTGRRRAEHREENGASQTSGSRPPCCGMAPAPADSGIPADSESAFCRVLREAGMRNPGGGSASPARSHPAAPGAAGSGQVRMRGIADAGHPLPERSAEGADCCLYFFQAHSKEAAPAGRPGVGKAPDLQGTGSAGSPPRTEKAFRTAAGAPLRQWPARERSGQAGCP